MKAWLRKIYAANQRDFNQLEPAQLMALTIYAEARGEPREGKIAVGSVILERVDHRNWDGTTIKEVCLWPVQFSCYLSGDPQRVKLVKIAKNFNDELQHNEKLRECYDIACQMICGTIKRNVDATEYINPKAVSILPEWYFKLEKVVVIGNHEFFR